MAGELILIVDDTPVNLKLTRILLVHEGYDVRTAASAEEALEVMESFHPRLVLADIQMPGIDGLEMTRRIKADPRHRDVVVVALTALAMKDDEERAKQAGCDGYITKPIDTRALGDRIRAFLKSENGAAHAAEGDPFEGEGIDDLRQRFLDEALQQVPLWLEEMEESFDAARAQAIAHQWIGSGGLLGYRRVSLLSREAETILRQKPLDMAELRATFTDLLDELQDPSIGEESPDIPPAAAPGQARPRVLIADDDPNVRALVKAILHSQEIDCETVGDGRAALAAIRDSKPQAIVLDVNMPDMSGNEVLAALRSEGVRSKVLLLTADEHPDTRGADDFLVKPFNPVELVVRLKKLLEGGPDERTALEDVD
jgi:two-component system cell cycle response regulator DivK